VLVRVRYPDSTRACGIWGILMLFEVGKLTLEFFVLFLLFGFGGCFVLFCFEIGSYYVAQVGLGLTVKPETRT
jgi:hypothetical protein